MFWIHGGGVMSGSGGLAIYDGAALCHSGQVIVVTVNHRLNALGYLYLGGISDQFADSGNVGQLDLVAALEWVRDNIDAFGGDPSNVTLFGQSGGGIKITTLFSMARAHPLFHKAIIESGSSWKLNTKEEAEAVCDLILADLGYEPKDLDRLLALPVEHLVEAVDSSLKLRRGGLGLRPVIDSRNVMEQAWDPIAPPAVRNVPMLIGTTRDEGADFGPGPTNDAKLAGKIVEFDFGNSVVESQAYELIDGYRKITPQASRLELLVSITTDVFFWRNAITQSERQANQHGAPVFMYEFDWRTPCFGGSWSPHASEIPFVFGNLNYEQAWDTADTPANRAKADPHGGRFHMARVVMGAWAEFARKGDPSTHLTPRWARYDTAQRFTMRLDAECRLELDPRAAHRKLLDSILDAI